MRALLVIDDLPLFVATDSPPSVLAAHSEAVAATLCGLAPQAEVVPFQAMTSWWSRVTTPPADVHVLVGTRPRLLHARAPTKPARASALPLTSRRRFDASGRTVGAEIVSAVPPLRSPEQARIAVLDDVLMTGTTAVAALRTLREAGARRLGLALLVANERALERVRSEFPEAAIDVDLHVDYEPVAGGTVMFARDLLFGGIGGRAFLEHPALLTPFLGEHLGPLHDLRRMLLPELEPYATAAEFW